MNVKYINIEGLVLVMADAVDAVISSWHAQRPDIDFWPVGVIGRVQRLGRRFDAEIATVCASYGVEQGEADILMTLRRAGEPFELSSGALLKAAMVTSGAITNRVDRMERKNLVTRTRPDADRRSVRVRLTDHGLAVVDDLIEAHIANEARLLEAIPRSKADQLATLMRELLESYDDTTLT